MEGADTMKRIIIVLLAVLSLGVTLTGQSQALTVGGEVGHPLNLSTDELAKFGCIEARVTELTRDKQFKGVFTYRGVPLRSLLEVAGVQKEEGGFNKPLDLAVVVKDKDGKTVVVSWGEIFYKNPSQVLIAISASPVKPHHAKGCGECHPSEIYQTALDQLNRKIGYPKLVVTNDFYTDRCLENVVSIEVVDLKKPYERKQGQKLFSPNFTLSDGKGKSLEVTDLSSYPKVETMVKEVGDGRGFHGLKQFSGASLRDLLKKLDVKPDPDSGVLVSSVDGYRSLFSFGEIYLSAEGEHIMIADSAKGKPLKENGKFLLVAPDDLAADRMIKAVSAIEVVSLKSQPKVYIISLGCGDTSLLTLEAISCMGKVDAFIASDYQIKQFSQYMGGKPVLFDPMLNYEPRFRKANPGLKPEEVKKKLEEQRARDMKKIRDALAAGKSIALLDHGDPTIFGGWQHWLEPEVGGRFEVITGVSAFNAANAMIANNKASTGISAFKAASADNLLCKRASSAILTAPKSLEANEGLLKAVAASGDTLAIFMGLNELRSLVPLLTKYYPETTPVAIAYKAGYSNEARLVKTNLRKLIETAEKDKEKMLGLIYIGSCVNR
jgi:precorrin-4 methylase